MPGIFAVAQLSAMSCINPALVGERERGKERKREIERERERERERYSFFLPADLVCGECIKKSDIL